MSNPIVGYEDHIPASAIAAVGVATHGEADDECFVCGQEWPCGKAVAYNDGLNDGALNARAHLVSAIRAWGDTPGADATDRQRFHRVAEMIDGGLL